MSFRNRTFDTTVSRFVVWTTSTEDPTGAAYPGPGVFGVDTEGYASNLVLKSGGAGNVFVYDSGSAPEDNRYDSWADLYAAASQLHGTVILELVTNLTIPSGAYPLDSVVFRAHDLVGANTPVVTFAAGSSLATSRFEAQTVQFDTLDLTTPPCSAEIIIVQYAVFKLTMTVPLFGLSAANVVIQSRDLTVESGGGKLMELTGCSVTALCEGITQFDNASVTGDVASSLNVLLTSTTTSLYSDLPETMPGLAGSYGVFALSRADKVYYDDTLFTPLLGAATAQEALDTLKVNAASSPGTVLWEWNQSDTTQFELSATLDAGTGGSAPTLTVVANADVKGGNVLRFHGNGRTDGQVAWLTLQALSTYNYRVEIETISETAGGAGTTYAGALMYADVTGSLYAFGYGCNFNACWAKRIDAGVVSGGSSTYNPGGDTGSASLKIHDIRGDMGLPGPRFICYVSRYGNTSAVNAIGFNQTTNAAAVPGGWTGLTPSRFGLWMNCSGGGSTGYIDIMRMRVIQL